MTSSVIAHLRVVAPFALGYFLSYLFRVVNAVIAPDLVAELALGPAALGLLTAAYFLTFAAFQLPLGVLLDRFGPRRVEACLLLFAALGAWVFARADTIAGLVLGRALVGFGVSACLMAAFKAFVLWYPAGLLPLVNGVQMAAGGLGAVAATAPVEAALRVTDWRGVFAALGVLTVIAAAAVFWVVPDREAPGADLGLRDQMAGLRTVFSSRLFWRFAPWTVCSQATFLAVQGLWAGPWLRDVAGLDRGQAAGVLSLVAASMVVGFLVLGAAAERLARRGLRSVAIAATAMMGFMVVQALLLVLEGKASAPLWALFGFFGTSGILPYAILSQGFPARLAGRANTSLNLLVFVAAFAAQWGIGAVIGLWPSQSGAYPAEAYRAALGLMLMLQVAGLAWFRPWRTGGPDAAR